MLTDRMMAEPRDLEQIRSLLQRQLPLLAERYGVTSLSVFGSHVRNEERPDSDLDLLVRFRETPSLLRFIELENYLSDLLAVKVDLVMESALKPRIGQRIREQAVPV